MKKSLLKVITKFIALSTVFCLINALLPIASFATTYNVIEFSPGDTLEDTFFYQTNHPEGYPKGALLEHGTKYRVADGAYYFTYKFTQPINTNAILTLNIGSQYLVKVSTDNTNWTDVLDSDVLGTWLADRTIDLTPYYASSTDVYIRLEDKHVEDGWGGAIWRFKLQTTAASNTPHNMKVDATSSWSVKIDSGSAVTKNAGDIISMAAASTAEFTKSISVPTWWSGLPKTLYFAGVEGKATIYVNGTSKGSSASYGQPFTVALSDSDIASGTVSLKVVITSNPGATGTVNVGLWSPVLLGASEVVANQMVAQRTFGTSTIKLNKQYTTDDVVTWNWLAGNFLQSIYDSSYQLNNFDNYNNWTASNSWRKDEMKWAHDSSRAIAAFAEEERYSPVVRLDLIKNLFNGVKAALVPNSSFELFQKWDKRSKKLRTSDLDSTGLAYTTEHDVLANVLDLNVYGMKTDGTEKCGWDCTVNDTALSYDSTSGQSSFNRTYTFPGANPPTLNAAVKYWDGGKDKPTEAKLTASSGFSQIGFVVNNFDGRWHGRTYPMLETDGGTEYSASSGTFIVNNPTYKYLILKTGNTGWVSSFAVVWDGTPSKVQVNVDNGKFNNICIYYDSFSSGVTVKLVPFEEFHKNMNWPRYCADKVRDNGIYGANEFDPTYACNSEGLAANLAAGAYILQKYGDPSASSAITTAKNIIDAMYTADQSDGCQPGVMLAPIIGCEYLDEAGQSGYKAKLQTWADRILSTQAADGTWTWLDLQLRNMNALLRAYRSTGDSRYLTGYNNARNSMSYSDAGVIWKGTLYNNTPFDGAAEVGFLGYQADWAPIHSIMMHFDTNYFNDSGTWNCSDLDPYGLGFSLKGCNILGNFPDKKYRLKLNEFVKYDANGITILRNPTQYVDNPNYPSVSWKAVEVSLSNKNLEAGLVQDNTIGDGVTTYVSNVGGQTCRKTTPSTASYMYFKVDDNFIYGNAPTGIVISVWYYDSGTDGWGLQYINTSGQVTSIAAGAKTDTNTWKLKTFTLNDAKFNNSLNNCDFRLTDNSDSGAEYITNVGVTIP